MENQVLLELSLRHYSLMLHKCLRYYQKIHYQTNMATMLKLGEWFDYLREQGVYDNTKIILVADHGNPNANFEELTFDGRDVQFYHPLLMVKDFGATELTYSDEFMTNADVATLATSGSIENPVNPFTNNPINSDEKTTHDQLIIVSQKWDVSENNGNTYMPARWASVSSDIWKQENWKFYDSETVLKEHVLPQN